MELRTLRYFTVVARELNITRAAEKLNMSQPPLSNQIKALEEELGVQLFIRGKRHLELTEEGALLLRRAVQMQELADKTRQELASLREGMTGTIYLSMVEGRAPFLAAQWIAGFREEFPLVRYNLWNGSSDDVLDRLRKGLADLAVIAAPYDTEHLEGFPVGQEPWAAMLHPDHPLAKEPGDTIPLSSLVGEPLIVPSRKSRIESIRRWFGEIGAEPQILCEMSNYMDAAALSSQGVGVSIFPQTVGVSNGLVVSKVVTQPARQAEYILVWNKGQAPTGLTREFIHYVQDCLEERQTKA
ncbi:MAG: LysR family transcriptional regulator [Lawsonibacter sp.]|jgi:DNA-binding transcriptional LysR family regulator|nr:LysR family transcriptional regulator [Lawsonibacter sp.]